MDVQGAEVIDQKVRGGERAMRVVFPEAGTERFFDGRAGQVAVSPVAFNLLCVIRSAAGLGGLCSPGPQRACADGRMAGGLRA